MIDIEEDFVMTVAAPKNSGKSYFIKKLLNNGLPDKFEHVIIMCPSIDYNNDYEEFRNSPKFTLISDINAHDINVLFQDQSKCMNKVRSRERFEKDLPPLRCPRTLLILDDCIDSGVLSFRGIIDKFAERGRHINLSCIISSQRISAISRSIRLNSDFFIIFSPYSISEMEQYLEQFVSRDKRKEIRLKLSEIFETPYEFILLDNREKNPKRKLKHTNADNWKRAKFEYLQADTEN